MQCPECGKDLIVDQHEDVDLVYCSCGYTQEEECYCGDCDGRKEKDDWPYVTEAKK